MATPLVATAPLALVEVAATRPKRAADPGADAGNIDSGN